MLKDSEHAAPFAESGGRPAERSGGSLGQKRERSGRGKRRILRYSAKSSGLETEPRYVKQRDKFRCGPVAIMNVLKWSGGVLSHDDLRDPLTIMCDCEASAGGTQHTNFDEVLRHMGDHYGAYTVKRVIRPTLSQIEKHLRAGGALVLNYHWEYGKKSDRHYSVVVGISDSGQSFRVVNGRRRGRAAKWIRREKFKNWEQRFQRSDKSHKAWFVTYKE